MCENSRNYYCSHRASHEYFLYSLNPANKFHGYSCRINILGLFCLYKERDLIGIYTQKYEIHIFHYNLTHEFN